AVSSTSPATASAFLITRRNERHPFQVTPGLGTTRWPGGTVVGAPGWPSGKAEDFGSSTEGSNPSPGTSLNNLAFRLVRPSIASAGAPPYATRPRLEADRTDRRPDHHRRRAAGGRVRVYSVGLASSDRSGCRPGPW